MSMNHMKIPAVVDGEIIPIEQIEDQIFSQKMIGDGYGINPTGEVIYSPVDGKIEKIAATKHAIYLSTKEEVKLLIHIGIDTIALKGEGFESHLEQGMYVKKGDPLVKFDPNFITEEGFNPVVSVVFLYGSKRDFEITVCPTEKAENMETLAMEVHFS